MANKNDKTWIVILIIAVILIYGGNAGWFKSVFNVNPPPFTPYPKEVIKEYLSYNVNLDINPSDMCTGDTATGTITSNIYNGVCSVFFDDGTGYQWYSNVNLNSRGSYSESQVITAPTLNFIAVCCDANNNCKLSNIERITTHNCDTDGDGIPDNIDTDDDNDGWLDTAEIAAGTDPKDPGSHPTAESGCSATCTSKGFVSGRGPFSSGSSCTGTEVIEYMTGESGLICCCLPEAGPIICSDSDNYLGYPNYLLVQGTCTDSTGTYTDVCIIGNPDGVADYYCGPLGLPPEERHCMGGPETGSYGCVGNFGSGYSCSAGKCVPPSQMTIAECNVWRDSLGKQYSYTPLSSLDSCESYASTNCNAMGKYLSIFDYQLGCCVWSCA